MSSTGGIGSFTFTALAAANTFAATRARVLSIIVLALDLVAALLEIRHAVRRLLGFSRRSESSETNSANNFRHLRRNRQRTCGGYCSSLSDMSVRRRTSLTKRRWHTEFEPG